MRLPRVSRNIVLFLAAVALMDMGIYGIMDVLLNFFYRSLGFSIEVIATLQGAQRLGGLLFSLPAGVLITRLGPRKAFIITGVGLSVSLVGMTLVPDYAWQYAVRMILGAMYSMVFIAGLPMVASLVTRERYTSVFSLQFIAVSIVIAVANTLAGSLPTLLSRFAPTLGDPLSTGAYAASLWVAAAVTAVAVLPLLLLPEPPKRPAAAHRVRSATPWPIILSTSIPMFTFGIGAGLSIPYYNLFFRDTFNLPDAIIGNIFTLGAIAMLVITLALPSAARRLGQVNAVAVAMFATSAAFFLLSLTPGLAPTVLFYMLALGLRNTMTPLFNPLLLNAVPEEHHGLISSFSTGMWSLAFFLITFVAGSWVEAFGYPFLFQVTAVTTLLTGTLSLLVFRRLQPAAVEPVR